MDRGGPVSQPESPDTPNGHMSPSRTVDVIVVGGGSCGAVVASRLSEDPSCSVLLLEAGPGFRTVDEVPPDVLDARVLPLGADSPWLDTYFADLADGIAARVSRGRVLGGSGAVNGGYFVRARPDDFDAWPASWSFADVLPYFSALERDLDFSAPYHGSKGPMPVSRVLPGAGSPMTETFVAAAQRAGFAFDEDKNSPYSEDGVGPVPRNIFGGVRTNAALAYLFPASDRPNLQVRSDATVLEIMVDRLHAVGVAVDHGGTKEMLRAERIVLCAGAVRTPQLLMLSGIGPADRLGALEIRTIVDQPNVGRGFSDHPEVTLPYSVSSTDGASSPMEAVLHVGDLEIRPYSVPFDRMIAGLPAGDPLIGVGLMRPESRGDIELVSSDPAIAPRVRYRYLESVSDRRALASGLQLVAELVENTEPVEGDLDRLVRARLGTSLHLSGSCAMGGPDAVLDDTCAVRGVDGLYVVDTSAFPVVPSRGPHATAIMLAERACDLIRGSVA